ncbi:hypothetical protein LR48_Vigan11g122500 [Vigna angularis]|uniref:Leucine-rich repeat-containing N-terminal plant-type domain-containing protein n=1 Tax=Phaseolus angularis TaxID=3914 RepID=A0A0L9VSY1_PHAAN|nr:hypothetical protein LR48_Vigan11g122500 [Vigna angularis]
MTEAPTALDEEWTISGEMWRLKENIGVAEADAEGATEEEEKRRRQRRLSILQNNSFSRTILEGFVELKELKVLDLGYNNFSGHLRADLGSNISLAICRVMTHFE